jgi:hypothetical protein
MVMCDAHGHLRQRHTNTKRDISRRTSLESSSLAAESLFERLDLENVGFRKIVDSEKEKKTFMIEMCNESFSFFCRRSKLIFSEVGKNKKNVNSSTRPIN